MPNICKWCNIWFADQFQLEQHLRQPAKKHPFYCTPCKHTFAGFKPLRRHYENSENHDTDNPYESMTDISSYCVLCRRQFARSSQLDVHSSQYHSNKWNSFDASLTCAICDKSFRTQTSLMQHVNSPTHKPRNIACPHCKATFKTTSGVAHHLECRGLKQVTEAVIKWDINSQITNPALNPRLITDSHRFREVDSWSDEWSESEEESSEDANERDGLDQVFGIVSRAEEDTYNSYIGAYVCPVPGCSRQFKKLPHLNQHLDSPFHKTDPDTFRCPKCQSKFSVVSALIQHLESGVCGLVNQQGVKEIYSGLVGSFNRLLKL